MNKEDEGRVFDADAIDKAIEAHIERTGTIEPGNETDKDDECPTRTNHLGNVDSGSGMMPPRKSNNPLDDIFEPDPPIYDLNMGNTANAGMTRDDSTTATRLLDKNWSPLIIRKYQMHGWPMFIGIICDANLNDLDDLVYNIMEKAEQHGFINGTIQGARNACGFLSDELVKHYNGIKRGVMEGNIVFWYQDKLAISSAYGDLMTHEKCAMEFYSILNMMPHI